MNKPDQSCPPSGLTTSGIVVHIVDGDTLDVEIRRTVRVRLLDCWCPESRTKDSAEKELGLAAKDHLRAMLPEGSQVTLHVPADPEGHLDHVITMGRVLGRVWGGGDARDCSQRQRDAGHATATAAESPYSGESKRQRKREAE